jgi:hypothetical protein
MKPIVLLALETVVNVFGPLNRKHNGKVFGKHTQPFQKARLDIIYLNY